MSDELNQHDDPGESLPDAQAMDASDDMDSAFISSEKKPFNRTSLLIFAAMLLGGGGVWLMRSSTGPKAASAATSETDQARATIEQFLTDGTRSIRAMQDMLRNTEKVVARFAEFPAAKQVPLGDLKTNPFRFAMETDGGPPKVDPDVARKKLEEERRVALAAVRQLKLQSIMCGRNVKSCVINNQVYSEGQSVGSIVIEQITPNSVIVQSGAFRFEVKTQR
jgi:hypothetical protein